MEDGRTISRVILESYRLKAVDLRYQKGYSVKDIAEIFGLHYRSVTRWFVKARKSGVKSLKRSLAKGANKKIDHKNVVWLLKTLLHPATNYGFKVPLWNTSMIRILLKKERDLVVSQTTVWRYLHQMGLTYQKPEKRYIQQNRHLVNQWLKKEWPKIQKWVKTKQAVLYFEDESGISLTPIIGKTWALKGQTPIIRISGGRQGILAMSAISPSGRFCFRLSKRKINSQVMVEFLKQIKKHHSQRRVAVIMDQAPCHKSQRITKFVDSQKQLKLFYLPPYSPELNPDEKVWRHLKHVEIKNHQAQDRNQLSRVVLSALRKMQRKPDLTKAFFYS